MPWIRLDDQFPDHPKVLAAGPAAAWLYVCGIGYCNRLLTDGRIPAGQVRKLADVDNAPELAARLVDVGLWEATEDGYIIHDFLEYQPSAEQVKAERADNARRQQEWRERRKGERNALSNAVTNGVSNAPRNGPVTGAPYPIPSRTLPDPQEAEFSAKVGGRGAPPAAAPPPRQIHPVPRPEKAKREAPRTKLPPDFPLTEERRAWLVANRPDLDPEYAHDEFCTYWRGEGGVKADWQATWQNSMLKARAPARPAARGSPNGEHRPLTRSQQRAASINEGIPS
jgi:hypothetical protein